MRWVNLFVLILAPLLVALLSGFLLRTRRSVVFWSSSALITVLVSLSAAIWAAGERVHGTSTTQTIAFVAAFWTIPMMATIGVQRLAVLIDESAVFALIFSFVGALAYPIAMYFAFVFGMSTGIFHK